MSSAQPLPAKRDWRWHTVPRLGKQQIACPICGKVDVAGQPIIVWKELIAGCWPCVFGLAADTATSRKAEEAKKVSDLLWTPERERNKKS